jgi:flavodoxin I
MLKGGINLDTLIVYTSMTGTTEMVANKIANELSESGEKVVVKEAFLTEASELLLYNRILIGSYTWGDGELPDEGIDFYEDVKNLDLTGKKGAVFGCGDSSYRYFARAVDMWEEALVDSGCQMLTSCLKIDGNSEKEIFPKCAAFCQKILK